MAEPSELIILFQYSNCSFLRYNLQHKRFYSYKSAIAPIRSFSSDPILTYYGWLLFAFTAIFHQLVKMHTFQKYNLVK